MCFKTSFQAYSGLEAGGHDPGPECLQGGRGNWGGWKLVPDV